MTYHEYHSLDDLLRRADDETSWKKEDKDLVYKNIMRGIRNKKRSYKLTNIFRYVALAAVLGLCVVIGKEIFLEGAKEIESGEESPRLFEAPIKPSEEGKVINDISLVAPVGEFLYTEAEESVQNFIKDIINTSIYVDESELFEIEFPPYEITITYSNGDTEKYRFWTDLDLTGDHLSFRGFYQNEQDGQYYQMTSDQAAILYTMYEQEGLHPLLKRAIIEDIDVSNNELVLTIRPTEKVNDENAPNGYSMDKPAETVTKTLSIDAFLFVINYEDSKGMHYKRLNINEITELKRFAFIEYYENDSTEEIEFLRELELP